MVFAPADTAAGVACLFYEALQRDAWKFPWEFGAASDDEPDAHRNSAASDQGHTVLFFVDAYGVVKAGVPRGLNFGLKAALEQYYRKPAPVVAFLRRFLWVPANHYFDDFQTAEPPFCRGEKVVGEACPKRFPPRAKPCPGPPMACSVSARLRPRSRPSGGCPRPPSSGRSRNFPCYGRTASSMSRSSPRRAPRRSLWRTRRSAPTSSHPR